MPELKVTVSEFRIEGENNQHIHVKVHKDGRCSVLTNHQKTEFVFLRSKPQMVKVIGELLVKAGEVAEKGREEIIEK